MSLLDRTLAKLRSGYPLHLFSTKCLSQLLEHYTAEHNPLAKAVHNELLTRI